MHIYGLTLRASCEVIRNGSAGLLASDIRPLKWLSLLFVLDLGHRSQPSPPPPRRVCLEQGQSREARGAPLRQRTSGPVVAAPTPGADGARGAATQTSVVPAIGGQGRVPASRDHSSGSSSGIGQSSTPVAKTGPAKTKIEECDYEYYSDLKVSETEAGGAQEPAPALRLVEARA